MKISHFTDIGLKVLMYLTHSERKTQATITELASQFKISRNHLVKVVHFMSIQKWLLTTRGKGGGIALGRKPTELHLGDLIKTLERDTEIIDCSIPPCSLRGNCQVKQILTEAQNDFYVSLNKYTLGDAAASPTHEAIIKLLPLGAT